MLMKLFQNYVGLRDKIHSLLSIKKDEPIFNVMLKNLTKLAGILFMLSLLLLSLMASYRGQWILGNLGIVGLAAIIYGIDEQIYYDELFYCAGIPMAIMNFFIGFIQVMIKYGHNVSANHPIINGWDLFASCVLFLLGIILLMTASSRPHTEIVAEYPDWVIRYMKKQRTSRYIKQKLQEQENDKNIL